MTSDDLHTAHLIATAGIEARAAASARLIVARLDAGEVEDDGFGAPITSA